MEPQSLVNTPVETLEPSDITPKFNLDDPALSEALAAREAAEQAIVAAVLKAQQETASDDIKGGTTDIDVEASEKASMFDPDNLKEIGQKLLDKAIAWLTSRPFLAQVGAIILAYFFAPIIAGMAKKRIFLFNRQPADDVKLKPVRDVIYRASALLRPILLVGLLALFALILKNVPMAGQDWLVKIVQGLAVVFLLFSAIKEFAPNDLVRKAATWVLIPLALLMVFGYFDDFKNILNSTELMAMGGTPITLMTVILLVIFGGIFFKMGNVLNSRGQDVIRSQETLDVTTREVVAKLFQMVLFTLVFILVLGAAKVPLSGLVVIFSALSLGIGLGLQPIAANFVSGLIILFDRSVKVGDFVMMEDEKFGRVKAINMRSTTVATADGKDIIVPNTSFTEGAYENWTHDSPLQRYEVDFSVAYDTDLDALVPLIRDAVLEHPDVLGEPDLPSVEFRAFGESSINMCVEFWCEGVDDGPNKFTSDVGFIVWRTLKANNIEIPFPQRVIKTLK
jgi:small-conductance mechanosensitive channel